MIRWLFEAVPIRWHWPIQYTVEATRAEALGVAALVLVLALMFFFWRFGARHGPVTLG